MLKDTINARFAIIQSAISFNDSPKKKSTDRKSLCFIYRAVFAYFTATSSTSKTSVASGGITPPAPALP